MSALINRNERTTIALAASGRVLRVLALSSSVEF